MGNIVGSGIFRSPHSIAQQIEGLPLVLAAWIGGGLLSLAGSLVLAELAVLHPRTGGLYVFIREAFGDLWGFLFGWASLWVIKPTVIASIVSVFALYFCEALRLSPGLEPLVGVGAIVGLTVINLLGVHEGARTQTLFTGLKVAGIALLCGAAFLLPHGAAPAGRSRAVAARAAAAVRRLRHRDDLGAVRLRRLDRRDLRRRRGAQPAAQPPAGDPRRHRPRHRDLRGDQPRVLRRPLPRRGGHDPGGRLRDRAPHPGRGRRDGAGPAGGDLDLRDRPTGRSSPARASRRRWPPTGSCSGPRRTSIRGGARPTPRSSCRRVLSIAWLLAARGFEDVSGWFVTTSWLFYGLTMAATFVLRRRHGAPRAGYRMPLYPWLPIGVHPGHRGAGVQRPDGQRLAGVGGRGDRRDGRAGVRGVEARARRGGAGRLLVAQGLDRVEAAARTAG